MVDNPALENVTQELRRYDSMRHGKCDMLELAAIAITQYQIWLTDEQEIPIEKLLSKEYTAVPRDPDWSQGLLGKEIPGPGWKISQETEDELKELERRIVKI